MNIRNFWIEANVDGSKTSVATGPRSKDGGFNLTIKQRSDGDIITAIEVRGFVHSKTGELVLEVTRNLGHTVQDVGPLTVVTKR